MKKELSKEELRGIKEIANRIKNQDPEGKKWGTAEPLVFLVQDAKVEIRPESYGDFYIYYDEDYDFEFKGDCWTDLLEEVVNHYEENEDDFSKEDRESLEERITRNCVGGEKVFETKRSFLTYKAAEDHIKANKHHYSEDVRIWCDHAWRNPEAELVHKLLLTFAD
jgi:hypothetical protein